MLCSNKIAWNSDIAVSFKPSLVLPLPLYLLFKYGAGERKGSGTLAPTTPTCSLIMEGARFRGHPFILEGGFPCLEEACNHGTGFQYTTARSVC